MSSEFEWNLDDLHVQPEMNYTGIHKFWTDQGWNEDNLPGIYKAFFIGKISFYRNLNFYSFLFSSACYFYPWAHRLLCHVEDETEVKLEEAAQTRAADPLGDILRRNETRL